MSGIELFACTITTDTSLGGDCKGWDVNGNELYPWRNGTIAPANNIVIDGLTVKYPSHFTDVSGHFFGQWGQSTGIVLSGSDNSIQNCSIQYSAGNGITVCGQRSLVYNNLIKDVDYTSVDCQGIAIGSFAPAYNCEVSYNTVRNTGRTGIGFRGAYNSDETTRYPEYIITM